MNLEPIIQSEVTQKKKNKYHIRLVQFSHSVVSDSLGPHILHHTRLPCPWLTPGACSNSSPLNWHPTISTSVAPFSSYLQSFPASGAFPVSQSSHQVSKVLEIQLQHQSFQWIFRTDFLRIDWFDLLAVQGSLKSLLQHHSSKASILCHSAVFMIQLSHPHMTSVKTIAVTRKTFVSKVTAF